MMYEIQPQVQASQYVFKYASYYLVRKILYLGYIDKLSFKTLWKTLPSTNLTIIIDWIQMKMIASSKWQI